MSPRNKRRMLDRTLTIVVVFLCYWAAWWTPFLVVPWGLWNFYDGMTRFDLPE
jgi:hypothetical protein